MLEKAMVDIARNLGGQEAFFIDSPSLLDYVTDLDLLEHGKVPGLQQIDNAARGQTSTAWPQQNNTLFLFQVGLSHFLMKIYVILNLITIGLS